MEKQPEYLDESTRLAHERTELAHERTELAHERSGLANERTFLAWTRTGLGSVGGGIGLIRFLTFHNYTHQVLAQLVGAMLVVLGIAIFALSFIDYKSSRKIHKRKEEYAGSIWFVGILSLSLVIISIVLLIIAVRLT